MSKEVNLTIRKTRKSFLIEYFCGTFLLLILIYGYLSGLVINKFISIIIILVAIGCYLAAELPVLRYKYHIGEKKVTITKGIITKKQSHVYYFPLSFVPDIHVHQSTIQRLLNCGTIIVKGSAEQNLEIKDINHPDKILRIIEEQLEDVQKKENKGKSNE